MKQLVGQDWNTLSSIMFYRYDMNIEEDGHLTEVHCFSGLVDIYEDPKKQNSGNAM